MIDATDSLYLEAVEKEAFAPVGTLYASIFASLRDRGLVYADINGYRISTLGLEELRAFRANAKSPKPE